MSVFRYQVPRVLLSLVLIITIVSYFVVYEPLDYLVRGIVDYTVIITAFALPVGAISLIRLNLKTIQQKKRKDWYFSIWFMIILAVMTVTGIFGGTTNPIYSWLYENISLPSGAALYALTAFYIASAAYRAFKARNLESSILLILGIIVMLKNAPIGEVIFKPIVPIGNWLSDYVQTTGWRVIWIGVALGYISLCVRYITGREKSLLGQ